MKYFPSNAIPKLLCLLAITLTLSSLFSACKQKEPQKSEITVTYVADTKDEILNNIQASVEKEGTEWNTVMEHLRSWGVDIFDTSKFSYFESRFITLYSYEDGLPETEEHAKETATLYVTEYYDKIDRSNVTEVTDSLLTCYVETLDDPYSIYRQPVEADDYNTDMSGKFGGIGVVIEYNDKDKTIQVSTVYPDSPAEKAGIKVGDFIHAVDGVTVEVLGHRNAVYYVRGEVGTQVKITVLRNEELLTLTAIRAEIEEKNVAYTFDEESGIGYVQIVAFKSNTLDQFKKAIDELEKSDVKGIIFDVRGNPGGYVESVVSVVSYILESDKTVLSYQYKGNSSIDRKTKADGTVISEIDGTTKAVDHVISVPMVVLCDEYTASAGEIFTSALRDYGGDDGLIDITIVGKTTFGKGIMQNTYTYTKDYSSVTLTVAYYNPPCGVNYHGIGITPDVIVELPTPERDPETGDYLPVEDTQLNAAILELEKLINAK